MNVIGIRDRVRRFVLFIQHFWYVRVYHMDIAPTARISFGARLDKANPRGVHIGDESYVTSGALILAHDYARALHADTRIGERCFIGANALIMPGVTIGNETVIGRGSVVTKDVPPNCIAAGNPARIIRTGIRTKKYGMLVQNP